MYTLHVRVIEADDIPRMDANATDAYCILQTSSQSQTTFAMRNSMHPRWNQDFHFNVTAPTIGSLRINMRDKDVFKDDNISYIDIQFCSLPVGQVIDQWYCMIPNGRARKGGRLHLLLHMAPANSPPFVPSVPVYPTAGYAAPPGYPAPGYAAPPAYVAAPPPVYAAPGYPAPGYAAPPPPGYPGYPPPPPPYGYPPRY